MKILLVDDSVATIDTFQILLESDGHVVFSAHNLAGALAEANQRPKIHLVLTDYYLPDGNGVMLATSLRKSGSGVPIIVLSAADEPTIDEIRNETAPLGNTVVFRKPVDPAALLELIKGIQPASNPSLSSPRRPD